MFRARQALRAPFLLSFLKHHSTEAEMAKKRVAVLVGCNYANTPHKLHGCINDVLAMRDTLVARFGFDPSHVELLTDGPGSPIQPTGKNIKSVLRRVIDGAGPGDVLFFHYSGHGTRIPSVKPGHPFRQDEAIVPCDFNLITDVDFRQLVNRLQKEASFTMLSDSCHSGGLIDKEKEQIGPASADRGGSPLIQRQGLIDKEKEQIGPASADSGGSPLIQRQRTISFDSIMVHLSSLSGISSAHIGDHLSHLFGDEASPKLRKEEAALPMKRDKGILLSGCQANETSADMDPSMGGGKSFGAFSYAVETVLKSHAGALSNRELVSRARQVLMKQGFEQHPCLYCSDENADAPFLCQQAH